MLSNECIFWCWCQHCCFTARRSGVNSAVSVWSVCTLSPCLCPFSTNTPAFHRCPKTCKLNWAVPSLMKVWTVVFSSQMEQNSLSLQLHDNYNDWKMSPHTTRAKVHKGSVKPFSKISFFFSFFFLGYPLKLYQMNEKRELADWGHAPHISCRYIWCNVLNFDSPSHRDGRANRLHWDAQQGGEKKGEEEDQRPVSSSHTFPSNQSQIVWQLILIQATQTQLHKLYRRLHRPPTNRPHKLSCCLINDFIVQHSKFILIDWWHRF